MIVNPGQTDWTLRTNIDDVAKIIQAIDNDRVKDAFDSATRAAPTGTTPAPPLPREAEVLPGATEAEAEAVAPFQLIVPGGMSPEQYKRIRWNRPMRGSSSPRRSTSQAQPRAACPGRWQRGEGGQRPDG